jgi:hypothetical protein
LIEIKLTRVALLVDGVSKLAHFVNAVERRALLKASEKAAEERERDRKYAEGSMRRDELLTKLEEDHRKSKQT